MEVVDEISRRDDLDEWSLTGHDEDQEVVIFAYAGDRDAIETEDLVLLMASYGYHLGYVIPDSRKFQFRRMG